MSKATEQNENLKRAIIISVALHIVLIALLVWSSFNENIEASGGGSDIDAVMVDPGAVVEQYNRQQNQKSDSQRAEQQRQKQAQEQAAEQQLLKALEKERLQAQEAAKAQAEQQKQAQAQVKAAAEAAQKSEEQAKAAAAAKEKAIVDARAAADAKAKAAAEAAKNSSYVDDLLGGLTSGKNAPKSGNVSGGAPAEQGNQKKSGASGADISNYAGQIQAAIQSKFYDWENFKGRTCTLRIKLASDGLLIDAKAEGGDHALCQAALAAARQARIPKPPTQDVYQVFKNAPLDFKPQ